MMLRLGLIGDNIAASQAPRLHRLAGRQFGLAVAYDLLVPRQTGMGFDALLDHAAASGYRGVNVTYPYKERAAVRVRIGDPLVRAIGAVNTVIFADGGPQGHNTDYSGFIAGYRNVRAGTDPGAVCMIGAGGVGRAVAFGLIALGAPELRIVDRDMARAEALAAAVRAAAPGMAVRAEPDAAGAARGARGLINCTPLGMVGHDGTPVPAGLMAGADWAFDAVYTPRDTRFLADAAAAGLKIVSGFELFFFQGVHAWTLFAGRAPDQAALRRALDTEPEG